MTITQNARHFFYALLALGFLWVVTRPVWAAPAKGQKTSQVSAKKGPSPKGNFKSEHSFDPSAVQGQYQLADGAQAVVEDEKQLDDLLGMRFEFEDRLGKQKR